MMYLSLIVRKNDVGMNPGKVNAVIKWSRPQNMKIFQVFIDFANFCRRMIKDFSWIVGSLIILTDLNTSWNWTEFSNKNLKRMFCTTMILALYNFDENCIVETDASDYIFAGVLSQKRVNKLVRLITYLSNKHSSAECNYEVHDKKLLIVILKFQKWRKILKDFFKQIQMYSDQKNLKWFV